MNILCFKWILFGLVLSQSLTGHSSAQWPVPPKGQPAQIWSRVDYDPKLTDPFFKSNDRSYWEGSRGLPDRGMFAPGEVLRRMKHTARCFSTSFGDKHRVRFCEAKSLDVDKIDLFIHDSEVSSYDGLRIRIRNGFFTSQYWTVYFVRRRIRPGLIWTTKRQKLTLD